MRWIVSPLSWADRVAPVARVGVLEDAMAASPPGFPVLESCAALKRRDPALPSGEYAIRPAASAGAGGGAPSPVPRGREGSAALEGIKPASAVVPTFEVEQKPGQRNPQPSPGASDRVFYETLYEENPDSLMALKFVVYNGCLPEADAPGRRLIHRPTAP